MYDPLYFFADGLGSVMALTDSSGAVVAEYEYDVYGEVTSQTGTADTAFGFAGEQTDDSTCGRATWTLRPAPSLAASLCPLSRRGLSKPSPMPPLTPDA